MSEPDFSLTPEEKAQQDEFFQRVLDAPLVKMVLKTWKDDTADVAKALMRQAFDAGIGMGALQIIAKIAKEQRA